MFRKKKLFWKLEDDSYAERPKRGEFALISFCKMVDQFE